MTAKKYEIIYADPPWNESGGGKIKRGADRHYPLMKTKDIIPLQVPRTKHSQKPIEMVKLIEKVSDREGFNKLEMFARERREGWNIWGNELDNDIELNT